MGSVLKQIWDRDAQELWIYAALIFCIYVLYLSKYYIRIYLAVFQLDGPPTAPFLGNANYLFKEDLLNVMSHLAYEKYGGVFRFWLTSFLPYIILLEPEDIHTVLSNSKHTQKIYFYKMLGTHLGNGLITQDVQIWKSHRKILQPAFHRQDLEKFVSSFTECADRLVNKFERKHGQDVNLTQFINDTIYEILFETVLGENFHNIKRQEDEKEIDDTPFRKGTVTVHDRLIRPWLLLEWVYKLTNAGKKEKQHGQDLFTATRRIIAEKRQMQQKNISTDDIAGTKKSLLQYMLDVSEKYPESFTDEDIANECCTFMLAGQESVSTATAITIFLLANHPEWQEKCVDEIQQIFNGDSRAPSMLDLKMMRCLEMCIKETLRLYPSVPLFARTLGEDVKVGKHLIPVGSSIIIIPYSTHRLAHHFPDPHSFYPERFNTENSEKRHPYAYLPFSLGPRNCIGNKFAILEMKAVISTILRRFQLSPVSGKTQVQPMYRIPSVRAHGGLWVKLTDRPKRCLG